MHHEAVGETVACFPFDICITKSNREFLNILLVDIPFDRTLEVCGDLRLETMGSPALGQGSNCRLQNVSSSYF